MRDAACWARSPSAATASSRSVWQDARFIGGVRDAVALSRSFDGGLTWASRRASIANPLVPAFIPTVAIRDDGTFGVTYYDFRSNTLRRTTCHRLLARAIDRRHHVARAARGRPLRLGIAPNANGLFIGDYMGLGVAGQAFVPLFVTTEGGSAANRTEVRVAIETAGPADAAGARKEAAGATKAGTYRAAARAIESMDPGAFAAVVDANVMNAMSRRVPAWRPRAAIALNAAPRAGSRASRVDIRSSEWADERRSLLVIMNRRFVPSRATARIRGTWKSSPKSKVAFGRVSNVFTFGRTCTEHLTAPRLSWFSYYKRRIAFRIRSCE